MALSFPTSPTPGQVYAAPNGVNYTWDNGAGVWTAGAAAGPSVVTAWCQFNSAGTIAGSLNVSSVSKGGTGQFTFNFTTPYATANYSSVATVSGQGGTAATCRLNGSTTNLFNLLVTNAAQTAVQDPDYGCMIVAS